jgi:hypothetical protein
MGVLQINISGHLTKTSFSPFYTKHYPNAPKTGASQAALGNFGVMQICPRGKPGKPYKTRVVKKNQDTIFGVCAEEYFALISEIQLGGFQSSQA